MSPIKGISEQRRLPRLGKIHLGVKAKNDKGVEYPRAVDYFVCPPEVQKLFGEKPIELRILIPVEDEEKWASQYYRCYSRTRGLVCKGDGEKCIRLVDAKTGDLAWKDEATVIAMKEMTCAGRECPDYGKKCKEIMNLQFLLPEVPGLGIWQIDTGSVNSIRNINSGAELIKRLYGRISLIPLLLTLEAQEVRIPDTKKKKTVYVLNLRIKDTLADLTKLALKPTSEILALGEGEIADAEMPISDDEVPDLIIPVAQAPKGEEPPEPAPTRAPVAVPAASPVAPAEGGGSQAPQTSQGQPAASQGQSSQDKRLSMDACVEQVNKMMEFDLKPLFAAVAEKCGKQIDQWAHVWQRSKLTPEQVLELAKKVAKGKPVAQQQAQKQEAKQ